MTNLDDTLKARELAIVELAELDRDELDDTNPIIYAESGPNRFSVMSLFFTDTDGVKIEQDLELNEITIIYFNDTDSTVLTGGPVYDWALDFYKGDNN